MNPGAGSARSAGVRGSGFVLAIVALVLGAASLPVAAKPPALAIHHVQISVANADRLADWYVEKLGFKVTKRVVLGSTKVIWIDIPGFRLGLVQVPGSVRPEIRTGAASADVKQQGFAQVLFSVASVDAAYHSLQAVGVHFLKPPASFQPPGIRIATLLDAEDNAIGIYEDLDPGNALTEPSKGRAN